MNIQRAAPVNELLAKLIFLMLPTAAVSYFLLVNVNEHYSILQNQAWVQALYFSAGMGIAALLYSLRVRFLPTYIILIAVLYGIYKGLDSTAGGEFDAFFIARRFQVFAILFGSGWLIGWGFVRLRYFSVFIAISMLAACIFLIAKGNMDSVRQLLLEIVPAMLYAVYIIFTAEQIYNYKDKSRNFWLYLTGRLVLFMLIAGVLTAGIVYYFKDDLKALVKEYGGGGKAGKQSMLEENKDGSYSLKNFASLSSSLDRSKKDLLFCAHINSFLPKPNETVPNPIYLTFNYLTKFDTLSETFEQDTAIPFNDLFTPNPSRIPLFATKTDSSVFKNSLGPKLRDIVESEIYSKRLSADMYLAPTAGFFVQPITVEKDFRDEFKFAYRVKSYTSELNSAYLVYNSQNKMLRAYQEGRFELLREIKNYDSVDKKFMAYYTRMPGGDKYNSISVLAHKIMDTAHTPVDKMIAVRNYFYSKDENGKRIYRYTDNPGVPDLPDASKLLYFLNESHQGYCAYYAGATLFLMRSMGIPCRIALGFLTQDRSDKNKGWYWFYGNQGHAWVQVYFAGYGWIDFDTTVGNDDENRLTPQPDGTPPMQPQKAWLAADGMVENVDTLKKTMQMSVKQMVFHDKEYKLSSPVDVTMDMKVAVLYRDSIAVPLSSVHKGDEGTAVSYADAMKKIEAAPNETGTALIKRFPALTPIDEVYLKKKDTTAPKEKPPVVEQKKPVSVKHVLWIIAGIAGLIILLLLLLPVSILQYMILRFKNAPRNGNQSYWAYRAASYYLHMTGMNRGTRTPMQFAKNIVDPELGTSFTQFMNIYLKLKYAKQPLTAAEQEQVAGFLPLFLTTARKRTVFKKRFFGFLNPMRSAGFFMMPEDEAQP